MYWSKPSQKPPTDPVLGQAARPEVVKGSDPDSSLLRRILKLGILEVVSGVDGHHLSCHLRKSASRMWSW